MKRYRCGQSLYYYDEASNSIKHCAIHSISKDADGKVYWVLQDANGLIAGDTWPMAAFARSVYLSRLPDRLYFKNYGKAYKYYENTIHYAGLKAAADSLRQQFAKIEAKYGEKLKLDRNCTLTVSNGEIKSDLYINGFGSVAEKLESLDKEVVSLKAKIDSENKKRRKSKPKKESAENKAEQAEDKANQAEDEKDNEHEDMPRVSE